MASASSFQAHLLVNQQASVSASAPRLPPTHGNSSDTCGLHSSEKGRDTFTKTVTIGY